MVYGKIEVILLTRGDIIFFDWEQDGHSDHVGIVESCDGSTVYTLNALVEVITETLVNEDKVQLVGFGSFEVIKRAARKGKNPQIGEEIKIPTSKAPKFKAGQTLKDSVNKR